MPQAFQRSEKKQFPQKEHGEKAGHNAGQSEAYPENRLESHTPSKNQQQASESKKDQEICPTYFLEMFFHGSAFTMRPLQNVPFCPISVSGSNFNPRNIPYIPAVEIFAFLDLGQN
jgi:hypothetical protein